MAELPSGTDSETGWDATGSVPGRRSTGLRRGVVRLVSYDASWPLLFEDESDRIASHFAKIPGPKLALQHIGSTSVPGLVAKPILDLLGGYPSPGDRDSCVAALESIGYECLGERGVPGRQFLVRGPDEDRSHYFHLVLLGGQQWRACLSFRERLRCDPATAEKYSRLKRELASEHELDRAAYTAGKSRFIARVVDRGDPAG